MGLGRATLKHPFLILLRVGFTKPISRLIAGELLPHLFTLTLIFNNQGGIFSVALSLRLPSLAINQHSALWSPDFPQKVILLNITLCDCLSCSKPVKQSSYYNTKF